MIFLHVSRPTMSAAASEGGGQRERRRDFGQERQEGGGPGGSELFGADTGGQFEVRWSSTSSGTRESHIEGE